MKNRIRKPADETSGKNPLEWIVFAVSCLLLLATLGVLTVEAATWRGSPAKLTTKLGIPDIKDGILLLPVEVSNDGDRVAAEVQIEIVRRSGESEQRALFTVDFVPRHGIRRGRISFPAEEGQAGELRVVSAAFREP
ncbi:MAG TPA: hypothetical protein VMN36_12635 [Verrucomicrobiales bacterium]|nr:hypothetical protein [Verrucomicrobiales bacterium]